MIQTIYIFDAILFTSFCSYRLGQLNAKNRLLGNLLTLNRKTKILIVEQRTNPSHEIEGEIKGRLDAVSEVIDLL